LVQEIVAEIGIRDKIPNMVIKLDMMKAYDRVEWIFLTRVLRRLGFGDRIIDMVFRLVSYNWYSILLNGQPKGFFKSTKGLKQGDPLSPTLSILTATVMSRSLNAIMQKKEFKRFGMPRRSNKINHMAFADDMIIMCKAEVGTLNMISQTLRKYEELSRQKVNKEKSAIYLHHKVSGGEVVVAEVATGILKKEFPLNYLGCPIFYKRKQIAYYQALIQRTGAKIQSWKGKLLSYEGRAFLIKHVLQSTPIHCLSVMNPPSTVLNQIQRMMAQFFFK